MNQTFSALLLTFLAPFSVLAQMPGAQYTAVATKPEPGNTPAGASAPMDISADGRFLLFASTAPNVIAGQVDANGTTDLFLVDLGSGETQLVNRSWGTALQCAAGRSIDFIQRAFLTPDGGTVLFSSDASDLLEPGVDTNDQSFVDDVFAFDRTSGEILLVTSRWDDAAVPADRGGRLLAASADRRFLVIDSSSSDLVAGVAGNGLSEHVFLFDRQTGSRRLISHKSGQPTVPANVQASGKAVSEDGRYVLFASHATDVVPGFSPPFGAAEQLYRYDTVLQTATLVTHTAASLLTGGSENVIRSVAMSRDGRRVVFPSATTDHVVGQVDVAGSPDLFVWNADSGEIQLISRRHNAPATTTSISPDGFLGELPPDDSAVVYSANSPFLVPGLINPGFFDAVFRFDFATGTNRLVSHVPGQPLQVPQGPSFGRPAGNEGVMIRFTGSLLGFTNNSPGEDLFLYDLGSSSWTLVSRGESSPTATGNDASSWGLLSPTGNTVHFASSATDLVTGFDDQNETDDLFAFRIADQTIDAVLSTAETIESPSGTPSSILSRSGRFVVYQERVGFASEATWLLDRHTASRTLVCHQFGAATVPANQKCQPFFVSDDGRRVVFESAATDLLPEAPPPTFRHQYLYDLQLQQTILLDHAAGQPIHVADGESQLQDATPDGRFVLLGSNATNLIANQPPPPFQSFHLYLLDLLAGTVTLVDPIPGNAVAASNGDSYGGSLSDDGRFVVFLSTSTNLVSGLADPNGVSEDVFVFDRIGGLVTPVSVAAGGASLANSFSTGRPTLTPDGRFVLFTSLATDLVGGGTDEPLTDDLFVRDRLAGTTELISHAGGQPFVAVGSSNGRLSDDGRFVAFDSASEDIVPTPPGLFQQTNSFLYDRTTRVAERLTSSARLAGSGANGPSRAVAISPNGRYILLVSSASDLFPGLIDRNAAQDVFLHDRVLGELRIVSHPPAAPDLRTGLEPSGSNLASPPMMASHGNVILFESSALDLVLNDINRGPDSIVVSTEIFVDGFESGNAGRWSVVVP